MGLTIYFEVLVLVNVLFGDVFDSAVYTAMGCLRLCDEPPGLQTQLYSLRVLISTIRQIRGTGRFRSIPKYDDFDRATLSRWRSNYHRERVLMGNMGDVISRNIHSLNPRLCGDGAECKRGIYLEQIRGLIHGGLNYVPNFEFEGLWAELSVAPQSAGDNRHNLLFRSLNGIRV